MVSDHWPRWMVNLNLYDIRIVDGDEESFDKEWLSLNIRCLQQNKGGLRKPYPFTLCQCAKLSIDFDSEQKQKEREKNWNLRFLSVGQEISFIGNRMEEDIRNLMLEMSSKSESFPIFLQGVCKQNPLSPFPILIEGHGSNLMDYDF